MIRRTSWGAIQIQEKHAVRAYCLSTTALNTCMHIFCQQNWEEYSPKKLHLVLCSDHTGDVLSNKHRSVPVPRVLFNGGHRTNVTICLLFSSCVRFLISFLSASTRLKSVKFSGWSPSKRRWRRFLLRCIDQMDRTAAYAYGYSIP